MTNRTDKVANLIKELSARFLGKDMNKLSLLTVTSSTVSPDLKNATIFITVMPVEKEESTLKFLKRRRGDLRKFLAENMETRNIPYIDIKIDQGEKNRQKIDELLRNG